MTKAETYQTTRDKRIPTMTTTPERMSLRGEARVLMPERYPDER
jgi:hypothetical protein